MTSQPNNPLRPRNGRPHPAMAGREEYVARMEEEVAQLRQAVASHASVDQAIGVLICLHQISPDTGFTVLRTASQLANTKLHTVADAVTTWARTHQPLPEPIKEALGEALRLHAGNQGTSID
ncbi:ANTAR domain-containing protein [Streptomyces sp. 1222.5]|uniref:ANTAR domain-containing protein n=1 Tax=unclassified Streptomyces TaxID=2593676 RepID=UPI00089BD501|nr:MULTISPECIES: ANTAR domain-containing protein [unclassified Streptomyces]PKW04988.1 ANTAR domain-containing protein [Streptomyces sp. 5112.2]SEB52882.1 ANTAR domain-containing protein [Streptomyces sp. 1222.5]SEB97115.1 ANTAR domain-containing protein [Streptomyces sp. 2231.1]